MDGRFITIGYIKRAVGLKGEVLVRVFSAVENLTCPRCLFLKAGSDFKKLGIVRFRIKRRKEAVCLLAGVDNRSKAEKMVGFKIFQQKSLLPRLHEGEYFWYELEGLRVRNMNGVDLGTINCIMETGAHDVLVVRNRYREILVPMVEGFIKDIDTRAGLCLVELPPGLLEATGTALKRKKD